MGLDGRPTKLYRAFSASGELLYVGIAYDVARRIEQHRAARDWWRLEVTRVTTQEYPSRTAAEQAERDAIASELPAHNACITARRARGEPFNRPPRQRTEQPSTIPDQPVPVAVSDIARLLGVSVDAVNQWRKRAASAKRVEPFPPAAGKLAVFDYWWSDDILAWAERTGRREAAPTTT